METKSELQQEKVLRERMRGELDVAPEDTLPELREDLQTVALRERLQGVPGVAPEDTQAELLDEQAKAEEKREPWRFSNGFVDDALYYADGQRQYEEALAAGNEELADDIMGSFNLAYQKELSGFTLKEFAVSYDEAHEMNRQFDLDESRKIAEKEDRKAQEFAAMRAEQVATAARWTPEEAAAHAGRDIEAFRDEPSRWERDYQLGDMARRADVNPHYRAALDENAPDIAANIDGRREASRTAEAGAKQTSIDSKDLDAALTAQEAKARSLDPQRDPQPMPEQNQPAPASKAPSTAELAAQQEADAGKGLDAQLADELRQRRARETTAAAQGENAVDVEKTGKELEQGDFIMPRRIVQRYTEIDGKFFNKDSQRPLVMFEDKGDKLATSTTDKQAVEDMVALAKAKQWESLKLSGSAEFRREAWLQAESQGIRTQGYSPKQADLAALEALREERTKNTITPVQERKTERQQQTTAEAGKAAPRHDLNKNQAVMHDEATKAISANMQALQKQPAFANRAEGDLQKLAYWRGVVAEENKGQPQGVKEEALARFDKAATDPQFLKRIEQETQANVEQKTTERVTERVHTRDTFEQTL